jgi:hypothetical protein
MMARHAAWYEKDNPTFSDTIALVRRALWSAGISDGSWHPHEMIKIPRVLFERLTDTLSYAV